MWVRIFPILAMSRSSGHYGDMDGFAASHPLDECIGENCVVHNPSSHHMRDWPQRWQNDGVLNRICPHGQAHPDPDQFGLWVAQGCETKAVHACDGCCAYPLQPQPSHRTAADVEAELSMLQMVRDVLRNSEASTVQPTALDATLRAELKRLHHRREE